MASDVRTARINLPAEFRPDLDTVKLGVSEKQSNRIEMALCKALSHPMIMAATNESDRVIGIIRAAVTILTGHGVTLEEAEQLLAAAWVPAVESIDLFNAQKPEVHNAIAEAAGLLKKLNGMSGKQMDLKDTLAVLKEVDQTISTLEQAQQSLHKDKDQPFKLRLAPGTH